MCADAIALTVVAGAALLVFGASYLFLSHVPVMFSQDSLAFLLAVYKQVGWRASSGWLGLGYDPYQGGGDIFLPIKSWLVPQLLPLYLTPDPAIAIPLVYALG